MKLEQNKRVPRQAKAQRGNSMLFFTMLMAK